MNLLVIMCNTYLTRDTCRGEGKRGSEWNGGDDSGSRVVSRQRKENWEEREGGRKRERVFSLIIELIELRFSRVQAEWVCIILPHSLHCIGCHASRCSWQPIVTRYCWCVCVCTCTCVCVYVYVCVYVRSGGQVIGGWSGDRWLSWLYNYRGKHTHTHTLIVNTHTHWSGSQPLGLYWAQPTPPSTEPLLIHQLMPCV